MWSLWKLLGFILYVILYYSVVGAYDKWPEESIHSIFFLVMPVMHLVFVVISTSTDEDGKVKDSHYRWNIAFGLIMSVIADGCLLFADYLYLGMALFLIAQLFYLRAFGMCPVGGGPTAASFVISAVAMYFFIIDVLPFSSLKVGLAGYLLVLSATAWRSAVTFFLEKNVDSLFGSFGAVMFMVSAALFAVDKFHGSFQQAPFWITVTYYAAQLGIALSACNTYELSAVSKKD